MKWNQVFYIVAAILFAVAAVLKFKEGESFTAVLSTIASLSFLLAAIHYWRRSRNDASR